MKRFFSSISLVATMLLMTGCMGGIIDTGSVGVRTMFGDTNLTEEGPGFYTSVVSSVDVYTTKEVAVELIDMKPKAGDNLSLKELDATVYYTVDPNKIADLAVKYKGQSMSAGMGEGWLPMYLLVEKEAQSAISDQISKVDGLVIHRERKQIEKATIEQLQKTLDAKDPGAFTITRVIITNALTDESVEDSIRKVVQAQKENEAMKFKIETAEKQAQLNKELNSTYTPSYLQHEYNLALQKCAENPGCTMIVGNPDGQILNLK